MNDLARQKLCEIIAYCDAITAKTGRDVLNDSRLCRALLLDLCGEYKREISVLVVAMEERVVAALQAPQPGVPAELLLARLTKRLVDNRALTEDAARWAVESWALALEITMPDHLVGVPASLSTAARRPPDMGERLSLPGWITEALASGAFSARLAAVGELTQLNQSQNRALAAAARAALERLNREDENPAVRGAAAGALGIAPISVAGESSPASPPPNVIEKSKPEPAPTLRPTPTAKPAPDVLTLTSPIHLELVRVPAGEFLMGSDPTKDRHATDSEQPQHRVYVSEFHIGRTPVTNAQYAAFVKAIKYKGAYVKVGGESDKTPEIW